MSLWVPPKLSRELTEERHRRETMALNGLQADALDNWRREFNRDLERIQPGMKLVWCPDPAPTEAVVMGARPGRWGIIMPPQQGGPAYVKPLLAEDGEG